MRTHRLLWAGGGVGALLVTAALSAQAVAPAVRIVRDPNLYDRVWPADMNGDGRADLVARGGNGTLYRYDSDGKGNFKPGATVGTGWNTYSGLY